MAKRTVVQMSEPVRSGCKFSRSENSLVFDCRGCRQGKDLSDSVCLKRVISVLAEQPDVKEIVLSGDWESLYREGCVRALNAYADLVRACRSNSVIAPAGEQCQACPNDPRKIIAAIAERAPMPWDDLRHRAVAVNVRPGCYACAASTGSVMARLESLSKIIDRTVAKEAFRIVGVSE